MKKFKEFHPIVNFVYFLFVLGFAMFFMNPVLIGISLFCAIFYSVADGGVKALKFNAVCILPLVLTATVLNILFNHEGATVLGYLPEGNPVTFESAVYGLAAACMIAQTVLWFSQFNSVMTSDKFIYLFGKIIPSLSLVLSMTIRFVPRFKLKLKEISDARKSLGKHKRESGMTGKIKNTSEIMSVMTAWSFEDSLETAVSMKSRGYGLKGRTSFSVFVFTKRDAVALGAVLILGFYIIAGTVCGETGFVYFPTVSEIGLSLYNFSIFTAYLFLCMIPAVAEAWEAIKWNAIKSKI